MTENLRSAELLTAASDLLSPKPARYVVQSESTISDAAPVYEIGFTDDPKTACDAVARLTPLAVPCERFVAREALRPVTAAPTARYVYGSDGSGRDLSTEVNVLALLDDAATISFPTSFRPRLDSFVGEQDHADGTRTVPLRRLDA